jgi:DNA-binding NarL/FixJ family response regulator
MTSRYRILIADDHALFRQGLHMILSGQPDLEILGEAGDGLELLRQLRALNPQIVLLDISMPHLRGLEAIPEIRSQSPAVKIVILTMHKNEEFLFEAIAAGADGYVLKDDAEKDLLQAIKTVAQGKIYVSHFLAEESQQDWAQIRRGAKKLPAADPLTTREREVLKLIAEGKSSREIGDLLNISHRTVERHRANMMDKLRMNKSTDLVKYALHKGYL